MPETENTSLKSCRICKGAKLTEIINLGDLVLTGRFPKPADVDPMSGRLALDICNDCGLVQLKDKYPLDEMYGATYGYRSSITKTMRLHLQGISEFARSFFQDKSLNILDIGSNDGTLLSYFAPHAQNLLGVDPCAGLHKDNYPPKCKIIDQFFSASCLSEKNIDISFDIITSIAMFYDLADPINFAIDIKDVMNDEGIWITEQTTSQTLIEQLAYDSICHEHLTYLSIADMEFICDKAGLKLIDLTTNDSNGSSIRFVVAKKQSMRTPNSSNIEKAKKIQSAYDLKNLEVWSKFNENVQSHKTILVDTITNLKNQGKTIMGFGASTKGNVILQFCDLTSKQVTAIVERDFRKVGLETPGTRIPIISEEDANNMNPDIYLVFPWHFRDEIIEREKDFLSKGGGLLFLLPEAEIVTKDEVIKL